MVKYVLGIIVFQYRQFFKIILNVNLNFEELAKTNDFIEGFYLKDYRILGYFGDLYVEFIVIKLKRHELNL